MGMETKRRRASESLWNRGIGAVTQKERLGYSQRDQRFALYQCKVAEFAANDGRCGICHCPMDPKYAVWANPRKPKNPSLAKWAFGQSVEFNHKTLGFESGYRSPDEILAEYDGGRAGYHLYHPWCMGKWRAQSPGLYPGGPAWEREFDKAREEGHNSLAASTVAYERIRERNLAVMAEAREHPERMKNWLTAMELGRSKKKVGGSTARVSSKRVRKEGPESPVSIRARFEEACRAEEDSLREVNERLAREEQAVLDSYGVKKPAQLSD
jgi:hypothetical protein